MRYVAFTILILLIAGCSLVPHPQQGGKLRLSSNAATNTVEAVQPENPAGPATTSQTVTEERKMVLPAKTEVVETRITPSPVIGTAPTTNETRFVLSAPTPITTTTTREAKATVGGAQKDEARTLGVKQAAMRPVMLAGIALLIAAGVFAYFSHWMACGISATVGMAMLVLFMTLPQHGLLIMGIGLGLAVVMIGVAFLAFHKGKDDNHNGIPDALESLKDSIEKKINPTG